MIKDLTSDFNEIITKLKKVRTQKVVNVKEYKTLTDSLNILISMMFSNTTRRELKENKSLLDNMSNAISDEMKATVKTKNIYLTNGDYREYRDMLISYEKMTRVRQKIKDMQRNILVADHSGRKKHSSLIDGKAFDIVGGAKVIDEGAMAYMDSNQKNMRLWSEVASENNIGDDDSLYVVSIYRDLIALSDTESIKDSIAWVKAKDLEPCELD